MAATVSWPPLWAVWSATNVQLEAEAHVRKLEEELRLEKDVCLSTTQPASELADKVGEQVNKLETLVCHFAKLRRHKLPWLKV